MKKLKKIFCGFISAATIMSSVASLGLTASAYDVCDVNHDAMGRNSDYNCGSLINKYHFQFYNNNPYMSY